MSSIRKNISSGIFYTALGKYSGILVSIVIGSIMARLLTPEEFGIVALVMVFINFFNLLSDFGVGPAIIQNKELTERDIQSIFLASIVLGIVFSLLFFFSSGAIALFYNNPELIAMTRLLSLVVLLYSIRVVPYALSVKKQRFKEIGIISVSVQLISGVVSIVLAYRGFGYYALIYRSIFDGLITFIAFYYMSPIRIVLIIKKKSLKMIARFSTFQFFFNFINYFSRNLDNLLIGKFISPVSLGLYDKSYQLMLLPVQNLTHVITPVLHPILSEFQNDTVRIYNAYSKVVKLLATIGFPLSVFIYFSAQEIILILYGSQWEESIPVFKILALSIGIQMVLSSSGSIFQARNRTDLLFISGLLSAITTIGAICYGIFVGKSLETVAYCLMIAFLFNFFQCFYILIVQVLKFSFLNFLKIFIFPILISVGIGIGLWLGSNFEIKNVFFSILLKIGVSSLVFGAIFLSVTENRQLVIKKINLFKNK
jgi:teichuronic acid exporter